MTQCSVILVRQIAHTFLSAAVILVRRSVGVVLSLSDNRQFSFMLSNVRAVVQYAAIGGFFFVWRVSLSFCLFVNIPAILRLLKL